MVPKLPCYRLFGTLYSNLAGFLRRMAPCWEFATLPARMEETRISASRFGGLHGLFGPEMLSTFLPVAIMRST